MHISRKTKKKMLDNILKIKITHATLGYCITDWNRFSQWRRDQAIALYRKKLLEDAIYDLLNPEHPIKRSKPKSYESVLAPAPPPPDAYDPNKEQS